MMVGIKNNRRTRYTLAVIEEAFLSLLQEKELSKITVTEICQRADINRGTFYGHYNDPYQLFVKIETDIFQQIQPILAARPSDNLYDWLKKFLTVLQEHKHIVRVIIKDYRNSTLLTSIFDEVHELALTSFQDIFNEESPLLLEYYFTYFVAGTIGTIAEWLEKDDGTSVAELTDIISNILSKMSGSMYH